MVLEIFPPLVSVLYPPSPPGRQREGTTRDSWIVTTRYGPDRGSRRWDPAEGRGATDGRTDRGTESTDGRTVACLFVIVCGRAGTGWEWHVKTNVFYHGLFSTAGNRRPGGPGGVNRTPRGQGTLVG